MHYQATLPWGISNRLERFRNQAGFFFLLALDHGLSIGPIEGLLDVGQWANFAISQEIPGVVLNPGMVSQIQPNGILAIALQTFGGPASEQNAAPKVPLCRLEDFVRSSADCISVQISLTDQYDSTIFARFAQSISNAIRLSIPVLCMINNPANRNLSVAEFCSTIRRCAELGATLIKVPMPHLGGTPSEIDHVRSIISCSPPLLYPGGAHSHTFESDLVQAHIVGYSGVCIGRQIFQSDDPPRVVSFINRCFGPHK
jgi:DhnA family fructose-bisphosphate aldolase class Ia